MATVSNEKFNKKMDVFVGNVSKYMVTTHTSKEQMAAWLGISLRSWNRKLGDPRTFTFDEIIRITDKLGFDENSCTEVFCFSNNRKR